MAATPDAPFELFGGHPALDFANTLDDRYVPGGPVDRVPTYERLLAFVEEVGLLPGNVARRIRRTTSRAEGARVLERVAALREAAYEMFLAAVQGEAAPADALRLLNGALTETPRAWTVAWEGGRYRWNVNPPEATPEAPLWVLAESIASLLTSDDLAHVRECGSETCRWLFLDRSRNHSRRWCDMATCGNREKARRFRGE